MKYLITGAAGFLGTNLALRLLQDGHEVIGLDNFHSGSRSNIELLKKNQRFCFIEHDVVNPYDIQCDVICNLACPASPPHYQRDPVYTLRISVLGTLHALQNAERYKSVLLQASTSEIYGDPLFIHNQKTTSEMLIRSARGLVTTKVNVPLKPSVLTLQDWVESMLALFAFLIPTGLICAVTMAV
jgi:nucleoside-diphosphate-sugar epimerase